MNIKTINKDGLFDSKVFSKESATSYNTVFTLRMAPFLGLLGHVDLLRYELSRARALREYK